MPQDIKQSLELLEKEDITAKNRVVSASLVMVWSFINCDG